MGKFDTHGGFFAPKGYFKVNTGGSHEENPNGGVQVGVDPQGTPNVLEEGEPVYNDYVFSDNIKAEASILKNHNIPEKFAGKLYSEIADAFVDEAEERPNDPISNNGLNAMLVRLSEAQEEQKEIKKQKELEEELSNLSDEELAELESILASQEQGQVAPEQIAPEQIAPEQIAQEQQFAAGGYLNPDVPPEEEFAVRDNTRTPFVPTVGFVPEQNLSGIQSYDDYLASQKKQIVLPDGNIGYVNTLEVSPLVAGGPVGQAAGKAADAFKYADNARASLSTAKASLAAAKKAGKPTEAILADIENYKKQIKFGQDMGERILKDAGIKTTPKVKTKAPKQKTVVEKPKAGLGKKIAVGTGAAAGAGLAVDLLSELWEPSEAAQRYKAEMQGGGLQNDIQIPLDSLKIVPYTEEPENGYALGGEMNIYPYGGWADFINKLNNYKVSSNRGGIDGTYKIDRNFGLGNFKTIKDLEDSDYYRNFTDYVLANETNPDVLDYLHALDNGTDRNVQKLFNPDGTLSSNWKNLYNSRRYDQKGGIYHFSMDPISEGAAAPVATPAPAPAAPVNNPFFAAAQGILNKNSAAAQAQTGFDPNRYRFPLSVGTNEAGVPVDYEGGVVPVPVASDDTVTPVEADTSGNTYNSALPTWWRYAGIGTDFAALGYNLAQPNTRFVLPDTDVTLPTGSIRMVPAEYRAVDPQMMYNDMQSQGNATRRSILNSGAGPSTMAGIVAADNNLTRAMGTGFIQGWSDANNRRNAVIAQNNQNEAQRAAFNYGLSSARAATLNRTNALRAQYDFLAQRLNAEDDAQRAQAISSQMEAIALALEGTARENYFRNQINDDDTYRYLALLNGTSPYKGV